MQHLARHTTTLWVSGLLLATGYLLYGSTGHDDSHITFWAAHSLLEHGEILNYNGERVEQSSSLLLTLLTALASGLTGLSVVNAGYLVAIASSLWALWLTAQCITPWLPRAWIASLLLGSSASFLLWTFSGMEATLAGACLLWVLCCWARYLAQPDTRLMAVLPATLALLLVRPEMPLLALALATSLCAVPGLATRQRAWPLLWITATACAALLACRSLYFGQPFPQPVTAKSGFDHALSLGGYYLLFNTALNPVLLLATLTAVVCCVRQCLPMRAVNASHVLTAPLVSRVLIQLAANTLLGYLAFIVLTGGDWMQAGRFVVPVLPLACMLVTYTICQLPWRRWAYVLLGLLIMGQGALQQRAIATQSHGTPAWTQYRLDDRFLHYSRFEQFNQEHVRDMAVIDHLSSLIDAMKAAGGTPVSVLSGQSGMVFYYTAQAHHGNVQFTDLRGLTDQRLTDCPVTASIPRGPQGLFWGYREFFDRLPQLQQQCGITAPDIIYDLNDMTQKLGVLLAQRGYVLLHQEQGFVLENTSALPWNRLLAPNMIFVRRDWLDRLPSLNKRTVRYAELPLHSRLPTWMPF